MLAQRVLTGGGFRGAERGGQAHAAGSGVLVPLHRPRWRRRHPARPRLLDSHITPCACCAVAAAREWLPLAGKACCTAARWWGAPISWAAGALRGRGRRPPEMVYFYEEQLQRMECLVQARCCCTAAVSRAAFGGRAAAVGCVQRTRPQPGWALPRNWALRTRAQQEAAVLRRSQCCLRTYCAR